MIGRCWARDEWVLADLERLRASAGDEEEFMRLPPEERFDFTWLELRATEHYKGVLAWPLHGGPEGAPRVVGCISIDVQEKSAAAQLDRFRVRSASVFSAHRALCEAVLR